MSFFEVSTYFLGTSLLLRTQMKQAQDISVYNYRMMQISNDPDGGQGKSLYISRAVSHLYGTEFGIWAGFGLVGSTQS